MRLTARQGNEATGLDGDGSARGTRNPARSPARDRPTTFLLYVYLVDDRIDLEELIGEHIFVDYTRNDRTAVVKGLVLAAPRGRVKLELTGNGPAFDRKTIVAVEAEVKRKGKRAWTAERDGDPPDLGRWREEGE